MEVTAKPSKYWAEVAETVRVVREVRETSIPDTITPGAILGRVEQIRLCVRDYESAHDLEDELHQAVLSAIAGGRCADPSACARAALTSKEIEFPRHCA